MKQRNRNHNDAFMLHNTEDQLPHIEQQLEGIRPNMEYSTSVVYRTSSAHFDSSITMLL